MVSGTSFVMFVKREYPAAPYPFDQRPAAAFGSPVARPKKEKLASTAPAMLRIFTIDEM